MNRLRIISNIFISITLVLLPITDSKSEEEHPSDDNKSSLSFSDEDMCQGENCGHQWVTTDPETGQKVYHIDFSHPEASQKSKHGTPPGEGMGRRSTGSYRGYRGAEGEGFSGPIISQALAMRAYVKAYENYAQISTSMVTTDIINFLKPHLDYFLQNKLFSSGNSINDQWIAKVNDMVEEIEPVATQLALSTGVPDLQPYDWSKIIRIITNTLKEDIYKEITYFRWNNLTKDIVEELENIFLNSTNPIKLAESTLSKIENQIQDIIDNPLDIPISYEFSEEEKLKAIVQVEEHLYDIAKQMTDKYLFAPSQNNFNQHTNSLSETTKESKKAMENVNMEPVFHESNPYKRFQKNIIEVAQQKIKNKYTRTELGVLRGELEKEEFTLPEEEPYQFVSPDGRFLYKLQTVYGKLINANPYHEQGILAREVGLSAVEVADEEYAEGNEPEAKLAFEVAEVMSDIALGIMPYVGTSKDIYEFFTGKHLLNGRTLSLFERSMSGVGIVLSGFSAGFLNSGQLKLAFKKTGTVLSKINRKVLAQTLQGLSETQLIRVIKEYPEKFLESLDAIGSNTKVDVQSALNFVRKAFARENPSLVQVAQSIKKVGKEGIENYTKALDELKNFDPKIFEFGKEFLARQVLLSKEIFQQTGVKISQKSLVQMGQYYARISRALSSIKSSSLDKIQSIAKRPDGMTAVWRTIRALYPEEGAFKFHKGMKSYIARYTIGEEGVYTALSKKTSQLEFRSRFLKNIPPHKTYSKIIDPSEMGPVLDLTDPNVLKKLDILEENITKRLGKSNPYSMTQAIGHNAKRRGIKAILAPSAVEDGGKNLILFEEL